MASLDNIVVPIKLAQSYEDYPPAIVVKQGEQRVVWFQVRNEEDEVIDLSSATLSFVVKTSPRVVETVISHTNSDFVKFDASNGNVYLTLTSTDLTLSSRSYVAELTVTLGTQVAKSRDITFIVQDKIQ
jgi:formylmethanofuran dehydrogenase subunit E-like metal-binding protein